MIAESKDIQKLRAVIDASYESLRALKMTTELGRQTQGQLLAKQAINLCNLQNFSTFKNINYELRTLV